MHRYHLFTSRGATMVELMVALAILALGITALLETLGGGIRFSKDTEDNIRAINIAREGIEAISNIRDTNWLRFSSDRANCWKSKNYTSGCIGNTSDPDSTKIADGSYVVYPQNGVWILSGVTAPPLSPWEAYRTAFQLGMDASGFFTQTGIISTPCSSSRQANCRTIYSREIILTTGASSGELDVKSIVRWNLQRQREVKLETKITNWKSRF